MVAVQIIDIHGFFARFNFYYARLGAFDSGFFLCRRGLLYFSPLRN